MLTRAGNSERKVNSPLNTSNFSLKNTKKSLEDDSDMWRKMDDRLKAQKESITSDINALISIKLQETEARISSNINAQLTQIKNEITKLDTRISKIESFQSNLDSANMLLNNDVNKIKATTSDVKTELSTCTLKVNKYKNDLSALQNELDEVNKTLEIQENRNVACDAVLNGIPFSPDENLKGIFHNLCLSLSAKPPTLANIFRTRPSTSNSPDSSIIIKFTTPFDKNTLLKLVAEHCKQNNNKPLCLRDANFGRNADSPIFLRECLTKKNHLLLQSALKLKKQKKLSSVFTRRGLVYVKCQQDDDAVHIDNNEILSRVVMIDAVTT